MFSDLKKQNSFKIIIIFSLLFIYCANTQAQDREKLEKEKERIEKEIANINAILNETKKTKRMSASELQILRKKIKDRQILISNINKQTQLLNGEIKNTQKSITQLYKEIGVLKQDYAQMLRHAQKNQTSTDRLLFIFSAKDYREAYQRYVFFKQYGEMKKNKAKEISRKTDELSKKTQELEVKKSSQEELLKQEEKNKQALTSEQKTKEITLKSLQKKEKQLAQQIRQRETKRKQLQSQINSVIAAEIKRQKELAAKRAAAAKASDSRESTSSKKSPTPSATPEDAALSNSFASNRGRLPWPTDQGVITSNYGTHPHPEIKGVMIENLGIDIRTRKGAAIRSVFEGEVVRIFTGPNGKKVIIIRHGEYMTVYTNLETVNVSNGSKVGTKQTIGTIASNEIGDSEMNFQVWKGGNRQNPASWIKQ